MATFGLVCGGGYVSGKEIMALELAHGLQDGGHDVYVIVSSWNNEDFPRRLSELGVDFGTLPIGFISAALAGGPLRMTAVQILRWPSLLWRYRQFLLKWRPRKVIHTNWHHLLLLSPLLKPTQDLFWVHEVIPNVSHYCAIFHVLSRRLECFVAVSQAVGESLRRIGISEHQIRVIHNGLSHPCAGRDQRSHGNTVKLGIVGQIAAWKGHEDLLRAFKEFAPEWPGTELHIYGEGDTSFETKLKQEAAEGGIADRIKWNGFVKDRAAIFRDIDVCVVPSRSEDPLPTVAIEAAGFGLPTVATRRGGLPEIIEDGVTGILVPANDPLQLAHAIRRLLADPSLRFGMGDRAQKRMLKLFSKRVFVENFVAVLESHSC